MSTCEESFYVRWGHDYPEIGCDLPAAHDGPHRITLDDDTIIEWKDAS